jgi:hypothetical protein
MLMMTGRIVERFDKLPASVVLPAPAPPKAKAAHRDDPTQCLRELEMPNPETSRAGLPWIEYCKPVAREVGNRGINNLTDPLCRPFPFPLVDLSPTISRTLASSTGVLSDNLPQCFC